MRRSRPGPSGARLLHAGAHLPELPRPRPSDRQSVRVVRGLRPCDARADFVGEHSARCRGRHPHPARQRGRGGRARRPPGRSLYFPVDRRAPILSARRCRSALPRARLHGDRVARRRVRGADDRRRQDAGENPRGDAIRPTLPPAEQGNAGAARAAKRRHVCPGRGRDPAEPHQEAARAIGRVRPPVVDGNAARNPRDSLARSRSSSTASAPAGPTPPKVHRHAGTGCWPSRLECSRKAIFVA